MSLPIMCNLNKTIVPDTKSFLSYVIKHDDFCEPSNDDQYEKRVRISQTSITQNERNKNCFLKTDAVRRMLWRFLIEKDMSEKELAKILVIKVKSLRQIFSQEYLPRLVSKVNLSLIKLYCKTKWI